MVYIFLDFFNIHSLHNTHTFTPVFKCRTNKIEKKVAIRYPFIKNENVPFNTTKMQVLKLNITLFETLTLRVTPQESKPTISEC